MSQAAAGQAGGRISNIEGRKIRVDTYVLVGDEGAEGEVLRVLLYK